MYPNLKYITKLLLFSLVGNALTCFYLKGQDKTSVYWSTWDIWHSASGTDPSSGTKALQGLNARCSYSLIDLHADSSGGSFDYDTTFDGDLIELGFFKLLGSDGAVGGR